MYRSRPEYVNNRSGRERILIVAKTIFLHRILKYVKTISFFLSHIQQFSNSINKLLARHMNIEDIFLLLPENSTDRWHFINLFNASHSGSIFFADENLKYFSYFSQKTELDVSCRSSSKETICMKCQILISGEHKKFITKLLSAELAKSSKGYLPWQKWPKTFFRHFS